MITHTIKDDKMYHLPSFICRIILKRYINQGFVYIEKDRVLWLDEIEIQTYSQKRADRLSWDFFHIKCPQYGNTVQLY